jgi:uncharacterized protein
MKFRIRKSQQGQYWFAIVASNGRTLAHSEQYVSKQGAQAAIETIRAEARTGSVVDETGERLALR